MAIDTIDGGVDTSTVIDTMTTLLTGGTTGTTGTDDPTVEPSTIVSILNNADLVDRSSITQLVTVSGVDSVTASSRDGAALVVTDTSRPVTVDGGTAQNKLIVGNDVAGTQLNTGTGSGTVVGGDGGSLIGTSATASANDRFSIMAGKGDDTVIVTNGNNTIAAGSGNNLVGLFGGNNLVYAAGNDTVFAGGGNDTIGAGSGNTTLVGGSGNATLLGGTGNGLLVGGSGNAVLFAGDGATAAAAPPQGASAAGTRAAGSGAVTLMGGAGNSNMIGGAKGDMIVGGSGNSTLFGGGGNDTLVGGTGRSTLYGGTDNNLFVFSTVFGGGRAVIGDFGASAGNRLAIQGYGTSAADLVRNAVTSGGNTAITLGDGTQITLIGFTGLNTSHFV